MAVTLDTSASFVIDGFETNAGDRVFMKYAPVRIIDGAETGRAAELAFVKDIRVFSIDGGKRGENKAGLMDTCSFAITGRPPAGRVSVSPSAFVVNGRATPSTVMISTSGLFLIDVE